MGKKACGGEMTHYNLFLDDEREPEEAAKLAWMAAFPWTKGMKWRVARSHAEFMKIVTDGLAAGEFPLRVSFDHDLGTFSKHDGRETTGADSATWLVLVCVERGLKLPQCTAHTGNPVGRERIASALKGYWTAMTIDARGQTA